jgi:3-oxoacyl-[acyl-carrier protein] reductase
MKTIIVTGGTRGLGLAIALRLAAAGYHVVACGRRLSPALEARLGKVGEGTIAFEPLDLSMTGLLRETVQGIAERHGHPYGLVNNAAVGHDGVLATMHDSEIAGMIAVNLTGTILLTKYVVRSMLLNKHKGGRVLNISSIIAQTGFNGLSVYAATKAALNGFTRSLARELGRAGVTVNSLAPGYMETEMTAGLQGEKLDAIRRRSPIGRLATVQDAAGAAEFLLSDAAAGITGTVLTVDAGTTA